MLCYLTQSARQDVSRSQLHRVNRTKKSQAATPACQSAAAAPLIKTSNRFRHCSLSVGLAVSKLIMPSSACQP